MSPVYLFQSLKGGSLIPGSVNKINNVISLIISSMILIIQELIPPQKTLFPTTLARNTSVEMLLLICYCSFGKLLRLLSQIVPPMCFTIHVMYHNLLSFFHWKR